MSKIRKPWTDDDLKRLKAIAAAGGTPLRAAAALKRNLASCQSKARELGTPFTPIRTIRRNFKERCAAAERQSGSGYGHD